MNELLGRRLNLIALTVAVVIAIVLNSVGGAKDWWPVSMWNAAPMLVFGYAVAWLFGRRIERGEG